jgi:hypothetical protein
MFRKPKFFDKPWKELTEEEKEKIYRWQLMRKAIVLTLFFCVLSTGVVWWIITPSKWGWLLKVAGAITIPSTIIFSCTADK